MTTRHTIQAAKVGVNNAEQCSDMTHIEKEPIFISEFIVVNFRTCYCWVFETAIPMSLHLFSSIAGWICNSLSFLIYLYRVIFYYHAGVGMGSGVALWLRTPGS